LAPAGVPALSPPPADADADADADALLDVLFDVLFDALLDDLLAVPEEAEAEATGAAFGMMNKGRLTCPGLRVTGRWDKRDTKSAPAAVPAMTAHRAGNAPEIQVGGTADARPVTRRRKREAAMVVAGMPAYRTIARDASSGIESGGGSHCNVRSLSATDRSIPRESAMDMVWAGRNIVVVAFADQRANVPARSRAAATTSAPNPPGGAAHVPCICRSNSIPWLESGCGDDAAVQRVDELAASLWWRLGDRPNLDCACARATREATTLAW